MYESTSHKLWIFLLAVITKYIVWIIIIGVLILYWFFPEIMEILGQIILLWGPVIVLVCGLLIGITANYFKFKKHQDQGITQYEIIIGKYEIYLSDLLIYVGTILILASAHLINENGVGVTDLIQALIFFIFANWIRQIFYKKIVQ